MARVRAAAVAGAFYPDKPDVLRHDLESFFKSAQTTHAPKEGEPLPKALIVPHAGYVYSGSVAASAYIKLLPLKDTIKRVVLLGPCHRVPVGGLALCSADYYETPLGRVPLDKTLTNKVAKLPQVFSFDPTHVEEHSLEVHLPFLQSIITEFTLLPLVVGQASPKEVADVLEAVWGGQETLIVISTDLSHFLDYDACQDLDLRTLKAIENFDGNQIGNDQACGRIPLKGLLETAKARGMDITTLDVRNSGDTAGTKDRVVGYGSWMLSGGHQPSPHETFALKTKAILERHGHTLLQIAAASIKRGVSHGEAIKIDLSSFPASLKEAGASFVTIEKDSGNLRGCIGSLQAHAPLASDIADNAFKAGFQDPRFPQISQDELKDLSLHISVLSPSFPLHFKDEDDLLAQLRPNIDGLIIQDGMKRALFLPSVWEKLPDKKQFITHLKLKAGLGADHWSGDFKAWRFITEGVHSEHLDEPEKLWQDS
ncbi:MEMO1 family protein MGMSR_4000 [Candidatus Terasakiella magnetica]|uniref:MEMO1 family protein MTBPR1_60123 n=1 Tax=Candidatus Terasakiella magnetica TaxID=1867952 RepID=A0A1C3RJZ4_9PROT|nr:AmmeMemoRadiSam system protein B [Candidatus Terasakiella magnetica]SCA57610.1 MEMO1 family protein MGMSR_4000 [Candidatus Terasakiella magnetica]